MNKFIRILSPITLFVVAALDCAVVFYGIYAAKKLMDAYTTINIAFALIDFFAIIIAGFVSREVMSNGVVFRPSELEFTGLDENNIFNYMEIARVESAKDDKASLKKNFVDRYSHIILTLKDDSVVTIDLGLTTKRTLKKVEKEINERIK